MLHLYNLFALFNMESGILWEQRKFGFLEPVFFTGIELYGVGYFLIFILRLGRIYSSPLFVLLTNDQFCSSCQLGTFPKLLIFDPILACNPPEVLRLVEYQTTGGHSEGAGLAEPLGISQPLRATLQDLFAGCLPLQLEGLVLWATSNTSQEIAELLWD